MKPLQAVGVGLALAGGFAVQAEATQDWKTDDEVHSRFDDCVGDVPEELPADGILVLTESQLDKLSCDGLETSFMTTLAERRQLEEQGVSRESARLKWITKDELLNDKGQYVRDLKIARVAGKMSLAVAGGIVVYVGGAILMSAGEGIAKGISYIRKSKREGAEI